LKSQLIKKILGYYNDEMYCFDGKTLSLASDEQNLKIVIVARHHYIERSLSLPITIKKELQAAIAFEIEDLKNNFHVFYKIISTKDGESIVTI